jgi:hypothetical protein
VILDLIVFAQAVLGARDSSTLQDDVAICEGAGIRQPLDLQRIDSASSKCSEA